MAKKKPKTWMYSPPKPPKPLVPEDLQAEVEAKAQALVEEVLKPKFIQPPPKDQRWNYLIDIFTKWPRGHFYCCSTYASPGANAISPTFEARFARMEYISNGRFNLAYLRHTGQWWPVHTGLTVEKCLEIIREDPIFQP